MGYSTGRVLCLDWLWLCVSSKSVIFLMLSHHMHLLDLQEAGQQKTDFPEGGSAMLLTIERTQTRLLK